MADAFHVKILPKSQKEDLRYRVHLEIEVLNLLCDTALNGHFCISKGDTATLQKVLRDSANRLKNTLMQSLTVTHGGTMTACGSSNLKAYVGTKIIKAEPMNSQIFETMFRGGTAGPEFVKDGYHVVYPNADGSEYHSWSPKHEFERAYREVTTDEKKMLTSCG